MGPEEKLEYKLGFDRIRNMISDRCSTEYAVGRVAGEKFCTDKKEIEKRTVRRLTNFFEAVKDGVYPNLKQMSQKVMCFPEVQRRIDTILDRFGDVKDTASDNLLQIRKSLKSKESAISKRANAILKQAQADGMIDSDASLSVREGKLLIPVNASNKKKIPGLVYDTSSTGKTVFIEPAEIVEIENDIIALHNEEAQEIQRILAQFSEK